MDKVKENHKRLQKTVEALACLLAVLETEDVTVNMDETRLLDKRNIFLVFHKTDEAKVRRVVENNFCESMVIRYRVDYCPYTRTTGDLGFCLSL